MGQRNCKTAGARGEHTQTTAPSQTRGSEGVVTLLGLANDWRARLNEKQAVLLWRSKWLAGSVLGTSQDGKVSLLLQDGTQCCLPLESRNMQPAMKDRGMSLAQLHRFANDCRRACNRKQNPITDPREFLDRMKTQVNPRHGQPLDFDTAPSWLVVELFVKPATRQRRCPFVDIMATLWPDLGGPDTTTHFASHSWGQCFVEDIKALEHLGEDSRIWICCFAMTQDEERLELLRDNEIFKEALIASTTTAQVLILDETQEALQRGWVLFEVLRAHQHKKQLLLSPPSLIHNSRLQQCAIDLDQATCTKEEDWAYIQSEFEKVGLTAVNEAVRGAVLKAMVNLQVSVEQKLGLEHEDTLTAIANVASTMSIQGSFAGAEPLHRRALKGRESTLGPHHPSTLVSVGFLGALLENMGKRQEALPLYQRALKGSESTLGPNHPHTLNSINNLGSLLENMGKHQEALPLFQRALKSRESTLGPNHPDTLVSVNNLGALLEDMGKHQEALPLFQRALKCRESTLGPNHPSTLVSVNNLGMLLQVMGKHQEALPLFQRALKSSESTLGRNHPSTLVFVSNLGVLLQDMGRHQEALPLFQRALKSRESTLGPNHPDTLISVNNLELLLRDMAK